MCSAHPCRRTGSTIRNRKEVVVTDYRHEWKRPVSVGDMLVLRQRLRAVMFPDENTVDGRYFVRSLYFDTPTDTALRENIIDEGSTQLDERMIGQADLVIFALYPHVFVEWIEQNQKLLKSGALITDVTGVKGSIVYKIQGILRPDVEYIAAHPMAGHGSTGSKGEKPDTESTGDVPVLSVLQDEKKTP